MKFGNLNFDGDVQILGNVNEGMKVTNKGYADIKGNINGGKVRSWDNVFCKNIIKGKIQAGGLSAVYSSLLVNLVKLYEEMREVKNIAQNKAKSQQESNINLILKEHVQFVQRSCREIASKIVAVIEDPNISGDFRYTLNGLQNGFLKISRLDFDFGYYNKILDNINFVIEEVGTDSSNNGNVEAYYTQNSVIIASGSVYILGNGCYNTTIHAGKDVDVNGNPGVFKGGEISAGRRVIIREAGSNMGTFTTIKVPFEGEIKIAKVNPNVRIMVGRQAHHFVDGDSNIWCRIRDDKLKIR